VCDPLVLIISISTKLAGSHHRVWLWYIY